MDLEEFGLELLSTLDLDPVYVLLWEAQLEPELLDKWLMAYWCFYHMGTATWIVGQEDYWNAFMQAALSKTYPRGTERRHFRGKNAEKSTQWLAEHPSLISELRTLPNSIEYKDLDKWVRTWVGFGPWISFKVCDMLDQLGYTSVDISPLVAAIFDSPREGAVLWFEETYKDDQGLTEKETVEHVLKHLIDHFSEYLAPPHYNRPINVFEAETMLCKWKSHRKGHYEIGHDIVEIRRHLLKFGRLKLAQKLLKAGRGSLW